MCRTVPGRRQSRRATEYVNNITGRDIRMRTSQTRQMGQATTRVSVATCCICFFLSALFPLASAGQSADQKKPEQFSATVFGQSGMSLGKSAVLNIYVNGYTSDQEVEELAATLKDGGSEDLLR